MYNDYLYSDFISTISKIIFFTITSFGNGGRANAKSSNGEYFTNEIQYFRYKWKKYVDI